MAKIGNNSLPAEHDRRLIDAVAAAFRMEAPTALTHCFADAQWRKDRAIVADALQGTIPGFDRRAFIAACRLVTFDAKAQQVTP